MATCPRCRNVVEQNAYLCGHCGADLTVPATMAPGQVYQQYPQQDIGQDPGMRMLLPVGQSIWAIAAGYLGLLSILGCTAPFAIFCGIMALREMRRNPRVHGQGRAIFGIVMGIVGLIPLGLICVLTLAALAR